MNEDVVLDIGDEFHHPSCPNSEVVGIDRYTMKTFAGQRLEWISYTLTSDEAGPFSRWWLVNVPELGAYAYLETETIPDEVAFLKKLSGFVCLNSEGDAELSGDYGALAVYKGDPGLLYAEEVFDGAERLLFRAKKLEF